MNLIQGDCLERLKELKENSVDSLVCDPPAGISFMGKDWDHHKGGRTEWVSWMTEVMRECLRVMKPGAHGLVWAIPRTSHWMAWALEDAGFEVRDVVTHLFGSGFPKSLDVSKAIDKAAGASREVVGPRKDTDGRCRTTEPASGGKITSGICMQASSTIRSGNMDTAPATDDAKRWQGFGTALKPASEHWILIRKPCSEKTVASNVLKWGTGAINVDASRVEAEDSAALAKNWDRIQSTQKGATAFKGLGEIDLSGRAPSGRFPANLILSHTPYCEDDQCDIECAVREMDRQSGISKSTANVRHNNPSVNLAMSGANLGHLSHGHADSGGASRFFYVAKASKREKNAGLEGMKAKRAPLGDDRPSGGSMSRLDGRPEREQQNTHPTVKSTKLMTYLIRMITPPGGVVLDCFAGSGTTGVAAVSGGWHFIGIERDKEYFKIAKKRIFNAIPKAGKQRKALL